jgi:signal transduction histidine kinase
VLSEQKLELEEAHRWSTATQDEIQSAFDDLTIANGAKTRFLATASHELKTPLTSISAFTDILKKNRSGSLNERDLKQLNVISRNVHRLNLLINDLLDLTRIDAGTLTLESGDFRISDLLRDMSAMFEPILSKRNQRLEVEDRSTGLWLTGDRNRMEQMITNLVTNASKFSPEGTVISMKAKIKAKQLELTISDKGVGIPGTKFRGVLPCR